MNKHKRVWFATTYLFFLFGYPQMTMAEIYKWIDADGNVHFADSPENHAAEKLDINTRISERERQEAQRIQQELQQLYQELKQQDVERATEAQRLAEEKSKRDEACKRAKRYVNVANQDYAFYKINGDGSKSYLTDEEIKAYRQRVNSGYGKHCSE